MSAGIYPSEPGPVASARALAPIRARGGIDVRVRAADATTHLAALTERGGYRLAFPKTHARHLEAVQINTGGGVVAGDQLDFALAVGAEADLVFTTPSAERIYRSPGPVSEINARLRVAPGGRLDWLPQETILYSGARLRRRYEIDLARSSRLLLVETLVFGRIASGEVMADGLLHDLWRVRRDGELVFAEALRLEGDFASLLARPALAAGGRAAALLLFIADDAEDRLSIVRDGLEDASSICGASAWNSLLVTRFLAVRPADVRKDVIKIVERLGGRRVPRAWSV